MTTHTPPDDVKELITRGKNLRECGYPSRALPFFMRASRLAPDSDEARQELRRTREEIHRLQAMVSAHEGHLAQNPGDATAWCKLGRALARLDQDDKAQDAYEHALEQELDEEIDRFEVLFAAGHFLNNRGMYEKALEVFDELIALLPDMSAGYTFKSMVLGNMHRYEEALPLAEKAIALNPSDIGAWFDKVKALKGLGRIAEAREAHRHENAARTASGVPEWMPKDAD